MAPSDVKRFVAYLNDLTAQSAAKPAPADEPPSAAATDFEDTLELLQQYQQDERVRNLLMDTSEETLDSTLDNVRRQLREVETQSIGAYIQASKPLDELHTQVRPEADQCTLEVLGAASGSVCWSQSEPAAKHSSALQGPETPVLHRCCV